MNQKPPLLVIDVDGVLNTRPGSLDTDKLKELERIHASTLCCFLLSSSWRKTPRQFARIVEVLHARGIGLADVTPDLDRSVNGLWQAQERWVEIEQWLLEHGDKYGNVIILDDLPAMGPLSHLHVRTDPSEGLTHYLADVVILRLSQNPQDKEL